MRIVEIQQNTGRVQGPRLSRSELNWVFSNFFFLRLRLTLQSVTSNMKNRNATDHKINAKTVERIANLGSFSL